MLFHVEEKMTNRNRWKIIGPVLLSAIAMGCRQDMADQPRYDPYEPSKFFVDRRSARPHVRGTIARGRLRLDEHFYKGTKDNKVVETFPFFPEDKAEASAFLDRGQQRYTIFCSMCHGHTGEANGTIVQRGYLKPPSFHEDRIKKKSVGHYFQVITNGYGGMPSYEEKIPAKDRWAIIAYLRALQLSQQIPQSKLSENDRKKLLPQKEASTP